MEVFKDHSAAERVQPSIIGRLKTAGRFAVLGCLASLGCDDPPHVVDAQQTSHVSHPSYTRFDSLDNQSLIGPRIGVERMKEETIIVHIERVRGDLRMIVDGKAYGIRKPAVAQHMRLADTINDITLRSNAVELLSHEYGVAHIAREDIERLLHVLSLSSEDCVQTGVRARFTPKEGTFLSSLVAAKRFLSGKDGSAPQVFDITFERSHAKTDTLAMADIR